LIEWPQEDYEYSIASQLAYDYYDNNNDADQIQKSLDTYMEGYTFDKEYSNNNASTFIRPDGTAILAYRGTRPTNLDDLNADASILAGQHRTDIPHPRFVEAVNHYNYVKNKYPQLDLTGHSLGGMLADYVGRMNDEKAVVFNPGETPVSLYQLYPLLKLLKQEYIELIHLILYHLLISMYPHAQSIRVILKQKEQVNSWFNSHNY
jgi:hypothetical protein